MSAMGRVMGHGMGVLFMGLGAVFFVVGWNDSFSDLFNGGTTCTGDCGADGVRSTFLTLGASFFFGGLLTSLLTEYAIRKTQRVMARVTTFAASPEHSAASVSEFLGEFGIDVDLTKLQGATVQQHTIDLRGQRRGEVPRDPEGLSSYLKERGVTIDESLLRNATVVDSGTSVQVPSQGRPVSSSVSDPGSMFATPVRSDESVRETATIVRKHDRGATAGNQRLLELEIEVTPVGKVPYRVTVASLVRESLAGLLIEGSSLNVRVAPHNRNSVGIDWSEN